MKAPYGTNRVRIGEYSQPRYRRNLYIYHFSPLRSLLERKDEIRSPSNYYRKIQAFFAALTFAHLARAAAAMRARPAAEIRSFGAFLAAPVASLLCFAQRAFCAARIFARPLALILRLRLGAAPSRPPYAPAKAATAALSPFNCRAILFRSAFNRASMFGIGSPEEILSSQRIKTVVRGLVAVENPPARTS